MPIFEARRGEIVWRFEPAADGSMRVLMGNGQQFVQVAAVRSESELNEVLTTLGLDAGDLNLVED